MRLSRKNRSLLKRFAAPGTLYAFDFDGTLAPIIKKRAQATMRKGTRSLLKRLALSSPVAIVTGRSSRGIRTKVSGVGRLLIIGNHGAEIAGVKLISPAPSREWKRILSKRLHGVQGVDIEDKKFSLSVHFVQSKNKAAAKKAIERALRELRGCKIVGGKNVFNLVVPEAPGKGGALRILMKKKKFARAIFVGDDVTDEDAFKLSRRQVLSVKIGSARATRAQIILKRQNDIDEFLRLIMKMSPQV